MFTECRAVLEFYSEAAVEDQDVGDQGCQLMRGWNGWQLTMLTDPIQKRVPRYTCHELPVPDVRVK